MPQADVRVWIITDWEHDTVRTGNFELYTRKNLKVLVILINERILYVVYSPLAPQTASLSPWTPSLY
jgi:hypothetical protein